MERQELERDAEDERRQLLRCVRRDRKHEIRGRCGRSVRSADGDRPRADLAAAGSSLEQIFMRVTGQA